MAKATLDRAIMERYATSMTPYLDNFLRLILASWDIEVVMHGLPYLCSLITQFFPAKIFSDGYCTHISGKVGDEEVRPNGIWIRMVHYI